MIGNNNNLAASVKWIAADRVAPHQIAFELSARKGTNNFSHRRSEKNRTEMINFAETDFVLSNSLFGFFVRVSGDFATAIQLPTNSLYAII